MKTKVLCAITAVLLIVFGALTFYKTQDDGQTYTRQDCKQAVNTLLLANLDEIAENPDAVKPVDKPKECQDISAEEGKAIMDEVIMDNMDKIVDKSFDKAVEDEFSQ